MNISFYQIDSVTGRRLVNGASYTASSASSAGNRRLLSVDTTKYSYPNMTSLVFVSPPLNLTSSSALVPPRAQCVLYSASLGQSQSFELIYQPIRCGAGMWLRSSTECVVMSGGRRVSGRRSSPADTGILVDERECRAGQVRLLACMSRYGGDDFLCSLEYRIVGRYFSLRDGLSRCRMRGLLCRLLQ